MSFRRCRAPLPPISARRHPPRNPRRAFPCRLPCATGPCAAGGRTHRRRQSVALRFVARGRCGRARASACRGPTAVSLTGPGHADRPGAGGRRSGKQRGTRGPRRCPGARRPRGRSDRAVEPRRGHRRASHARPVCVGAAGVGARGRCLRRSSRRRPGPAGAARLPVYCAAARGDLPGAKLALQLARDGGAPVSLAAAAIARLSKISTPAPPLPKQLTVLDYLFLNLGGKRPSADLAAKADPDLLFLLARDPSAPAELRVDVGRARCRAQHHRR